MQGVAPVELGSPRCQDCAVWVQFSSNIIRPEELVNPTSAVASVQNSNPLFKLIAY